MIQEIFRLYAERSSFFAELILQHIRIAGISVTVSLVLGLVIGVIISEYRKPAQIIMNAVHYPLDFHAGLSDSFYGNRG